MSERPPQSLKELVERVPEGEARLALQALLREVERLHGEVSDRDHALAGVRKYLQRAFSMTFDGWLTAYGPGGAAPLENKGTSAGEHPAVVRLLSAQAGHEVDRDALAVAEAEGDFMEFCRRAFRVLEAEVTSFVRDARKANPTTVAASWDLMQKRRADRSEWAKERSRKEGRDVSSWRDYDRKPLADDLKRASMSDLVEFVFYFLYGVQYSNASKRKPTLSYDRYWTLTRVREVRNEASHSSGENPAFQRRETQAFFEGRDFAAVRVALAEFEADLGERRASWAEQADATDGGTTG